MGYGYSEQQDAERQTLDALNEAEQLRAERVREFIERRRHAAEETPTFEPKANLPPRWKCGWDDNRGE